MAIDSREKGKRGEYLVRDLLREKTRLGWERVPGSGAFGQSHGLKGDVYLPPASGHMSHYCFEIKWYKDDQLSSNLFNIGESTFEKWWEQTAREAVQMNMKPALVFKKDRGAWLIALSANDPICDSLFDRTHMILSKKDIEVVIGAFEPWLHNIDTKDLYK